MKVVCFFAFTITLLLQSQDALSWMRRAGGMSKVMPANAEIEELALKMKEDAENMLHRKFEMFKAESYATQVVAGTNYFIKVKVSESEYAHIRVYKPLPYTRLEPELSNALDRKTATDPLEYF